MVAFNNCEDLKNVEIFEGLETILGGAFQDCTSLERIVIPSSTKCIGEMAFQFCKQLKDIQLSEGVNKIMERAFDFCTSLEQISIPSSVGSL